MNHETAGRVRWEILYIVASVLLVFHMGGPNLVWYSVVIGALVGLIVGALTSLGLHWWVFSRSIVVAICVAGAVEKLRGGAKPTTTPPAR
jgi:hypothetical protein